MTGVAQFAVIIYLTTYLSLESLGVYALFVIVLGYFSQLAGFSFHVFLVRELGGKGREEWPCMLMQQWRFLFFNILLAILVASFLFYLEFIPFQYALYFYAILTLSVVNNQFENFMVGAGYPVSATLNLLLRTIWILPLYALSIMILSQLDLGMVFSAWFVAELLAAMFIVAQVRNVGLLPIRWCPADLVWIVRGVKVGAWYTFLGFLVLLTISVQRVILGQYHSEDQVGVFHFFFVISVFVPNLLEASLYAIILPRLIQLNKPAGIKKSSMPDSRLFLAIVAAGFFLFLLSLMLPYGLSMLGKPELLSYRHIFSYTAVYALLYSSSRVFHYQLYTSHNDKALATAYVISCIVACSASIVLIPSYGLDGAAIALVIAGVALLLSCAWPFVKRKK